MRSPVRSKHRYIKNLPVWYKYIRYFIRCFFVFRNPLRFLRCYLSVTPPPGKRVCLRNGHAIGLSDDPLDIVTVFLVFVKKDYGSIPPGSVVLDIGANIGIFCLYAASCGARKVYAYEPAAESFACLLENSRSNGLEGTIEPRMRAVAGTGNATVWFPARSSVYSSIAAGSRTSGCRQVHTASLAGIISSIGGSGIDLLKIDSEGAEYDILYAAPAETFTKIRAIRMEYHKGHADELAAFLTRRGFRKTRHVPESGISGTIWFERQGPRTS